MTQKYQVRYLAEGRRIFAAPWLIVVYFCYTVIASYAAAYLLSLQIGATLLIEPLLFSYIAGRYFIDAVDPQRLPCHRRMRWRLYVPFVKIFAMLFVADIAAQTVCFWLYPRNDNIPFVLSGLHAVMSVVAVFWMITALFCRGNVWHGWRTALRLMRDHGALSAVFLAGYLAFKLSLDLWGYRTVQGSAIVFLLLRGAYVIFDLGASRVAIACAAASKYLPDPHATLDEYTSGELAVRKVPDRALQMKRANICLILGILSIVPVIHLLALAIGWTRFRGQEYGRFRSIVGFTLGSFFTVLYCLALIGHAAHVGTKRAAGVHLRGLDGYFQDASVNAGVKEAIAQLRAGKGGDPRSAALRLEALPDDRTQARYFTLGLAYAAAYDPDRALAAFEKCLTMPGWRPEVLFHMGRIRLFQAHDFFKARNDLVGFLKYRPGDTAARLYVDLIDNRVAWDKNWIISLLSVIALLIAMTCHEFGHSYAAYRCGDMTPRDAGRMSLNPVVHLDLFGSIILPASLILSSSTVIVGWAKPVPVNPENFRDPKRDTVSVSVMGCFTNFTLAMAATIVLVLASVAIAVFAPHVVSMNWLYPSGFVSVAGLPFAKFWIYTAVFFSVLIMVNIAIGMFNLIPIPPLDGSWMVERRLRSLLKDHYPAYHQFSFLLILVLLFSGAVDAVIGTALNAYFMFVQVVFVPAFNLI